LIVGGTSNAPVYLRDVATVKDSVQDERVNMRFWVRGYTVPTATVIVAVNRRAGGERGRSFEINPSDVAGDWGRVAGVDQDHADLRSLSKHRPFSRRRAGTLHHRVLCWS
jgi:hypothetical protein